MKYQAYIFDLDGTLLDTLPDLVRLTNMVLAERGWPERTRDEILSFVGNGGRDLLRRAVPADVADARIDEAFSRWQDLYPTYGHAMTRPYDGIPEMLAQLKDSGAKLGVLSNKFDEAVRQVVEEQLPGIFDIARGECAGVPRKPDPAGLLDMMGRLGVAPEQVAYVGDSASDIEVARRAGVFGVGVSWGYRSTQVLEDAGARVVINHPGELLLLAEGDVPII